MMVTRPALSIPDYELLRPIGRGAYGEVWLGRSTATGVLRAVKIVYRRTLAGWLMAAAEAYLIAVSEARRTEREKQNVEQLLYAESSPFGGVKDSGLGIKEGVIEAMKSMTTVKTFSLPW